MHATLPDDLGDGTLARPRLCVEAWLAVPVPDRYLLLLLRRAPDHGGFWQGVSGRVEREDASYADAARREIREETGLETAHVVLRDLGGAATFQGVVSGRWFHKRVLGVLFPEEVHAHDVVLSEEHDVVRRVDFAEARRLVQFPESESALRDFEQWLQEARGRKR